MRLKNDEIQIEVMPAEGGRIASLRCAGSGLEFLMQPHRPMRLTHASRDAGFIDGAVAGIEECMPTVSRCVVDGETIPDHGDLWQLAWDVTATSEDAVSLQAQCFSRPLRYEKTIRLVGAVVRVESRIVNVGAAPARFLYAAHPLLAVDAGDRIVLPEECAELALHSSLKERVGVDRSRIAWPLVEGVDLSLLGDVYARTAEMLYTDRLREGWCGLYRARHAQGIAVRFDTAELGYMGLWICCGGWPDEPPFQYAFAPEPATSPCGSLAQAVEQGLAETLQPGESFRFAIEYRVSPSNLDLQGFARFAAG
ncbi:DUF4432 family protein [Granulicella rosea]|nr:DUF4432 family protein [Granulicella rosea]